MLIEDAQSASCRYQRRTSEMGDPLPQRLVAPQRLSHRTDGCIPPEGQGTVRTCTIICSSRCMCLYQHFSSTDHPPSTRFSWCGSKIKTRDREQLLEGSQIAQSMHFDLSRPQSQRRVLNAGPGFDKRLRALNDHQVSTRSPPFADMTAATCNMESPDTPSGPENSITAVKCVCAACSRSMFRANEAIK